MLLTLPDDAMRCCAPTRVNAAAASCCALTWMNVQLDAGFGSIRIYCLALRGEEMVVVQQKGIREGQDSILNHAM